MTTLTHTQYDALAAALTDGGIRGTHTHRNSYTRGFILVFNYDGDEHEITVDGQAAHQFTEYNEGDLEDYIYNFEHLMEEFQEWADQQEDDPTPSDWLADLFETNRTRYDEIVQNWKNDTSDMMTEYWQDIGSDEYLFPEVMAEALDHLNLEAPTLLDEIVEALGSVEDDRIYTNLFERAAHVECEQRLGETILDYKYGPNGITYYATVARVNWGWGGLDNITVRIVEYVTNDECGDGEAQDQGTIVETVEEAEAEIKRIRTGWRKAMLKAA